MLRTCVWLYGIFISCVMFSIIAMSNANAAPEDATRFVDSVGQSVLGTLDAGSSKEEKQAALRQMFTEHVDLEWMGKFVLGRNWAKATEDQKSRYLSAYREYLLTRYTKNFSEYTGSKYSITSTTPLDDGQYNVGMAIKSPNAQEQDTIAGYRVREENGQFKIIDIVVEGVSLLTTQRSEFASAVQKGGMDKLIEQLQAKTHPAA